VAQLAKLPSHLMTTAKMLITLPLGCHQAVVVPPSASLTGDRGIRSTDFLLQFFKNSLVLLVYARGTR